LLFHCREAALLLVVEEKNVPRTVRVVTPIALWAMTLLAIPHDIDTLTVWTMNLYIGHSILLYEQGQRCHSISMSTHLKHHHFVILIVLTLRSIWSSRKMFQDPFGNMLDNTLKLAEIQATSINMLYKYESEELKYG